MDEKSEKIFSANGVVLGLKSPGPIHLENFAIGTLVRPNLPLLNFSLASG
ncbi:MAG: hypothetical protein ACJAVI_004085 [Candidatus Azotimanducaceae bacterium]|jgi:hypothetical protein